MRLNLNHYTAEYARLSAAELKELVRRAHAGNPELLAPLQAEVTKRGMQDETRILDNLLLTYKKEGYPAFFASIDADDVKEVVQFLKTRLPNKATQKNYQLTHKQVQAIDNKTMTLDSKLQKVADRMCAHLMIQKPIKVMTINGLEGGKYQLIENYSCILIGADTVNQNFYQKVAILAHEMSHYYLIYEHQIVNPIEQENELLTEVNAVYIGFGFLLHRGYESFSRREGDMTKTSRVGYITAQLIFEAIIETAYARKQKPQWIVRNISVFYKLHSIFRLFPLWRAYRRSKKGN